MERRPKEIKAPERPVRFIFAGGFLGSGKTTALAGLAKLLVRRGMKVGIVTNDQTVNLVDTAIVRKMLEELDVTVEEVAGGCFCCRFDDLIERVDKILAQNPDVLMGELVGSCADFAATVGNPIKHYYKGIFELAPFSVLVEPQRVRSLLLGEVETLFPDEVSYLFRMQLEEADVIVLNKIDLLSESEREGLLAALKERFPTKDVMAVSAKENIGLEEWLRVLLSERPAAASVLRELDYDRYAKAEAVLGWLNAAVQLSSPRPFNPRSFSFELANSLRSRFKEEETEIAHLKLVLMSEGRAMWTSVISVDAEPVTGGEEMGEVSEASLVINARVRTEPQRLEKIAVEVLPQVAREMGLKAEITDMQCFSPPYPKPPYRITEPVG